ncbi:d-alanine ligase [Grosmannia clavigera kw1407]|uniref:D-alanine ligase n=1 Tax=Grosmannia clavigera (strain kw1407 / UAMH 11150) TaxID=655863 RepID=F0XD72_GROCL|nr:d-alanine ligase [Grosmannia clavigera kw1407]EFX03765.1 d-alanine ligase [Grosmannia clavigera kw1407]
MPLLADGPVRVAVLYQALEPPIINGEKKPMKPGGYQDSGADIAFALQGSEGIDVVTPRDDPDPADHHGWAFPDTEEGILEALSRGATHVWANTVLFASHPLQTSAAIGAYQDRVRVIGQGPLAVERYDDKDYINRLLRGLGGFTLPRSWSLSATTDPAAVHELPGIAYSVVGKPARGRGSYGVKVCHTADELQDHVRELQSETMHVLIEQFLAGEEVTVTVMPPAVAGKTDYWALPVVTRFDHEDGIAPSNGSVAVSTNSRAVSDSDKDPLYRALMRECEAVARALGTTAPIRVDARRHRDAASSKFALLDVNTKPNMTGPGRPGRDDQACLTLLAAEALGWEYRELLERILRTASVLRDLRQVVPK